MSAELTAEEHVDLSLAYSWWYAHGDPSIFSDVLEDVAKRIESATEQRVRAEIAAEIEAACDAVTSPCDCYKAARIARGASAGEVTT